MLSLISLLSVHTIFSYEDIGYAVVACGYWLSDTQFQIAVVQSIEATMRELEDLREREKVLHELYPLL